MTDELKACPFCGGNIIYRAATASLDDGYTVCQECGAFHGNEAWNSRPLEDALLKRAECADADANRLAKLLIQQQNRVKQAERMIERLIEAGEGSQYQMFQTLVAEWQARDE